MKLETERLILRLWQENDLHSFIQLSNDPGLNNFSTGRFENMTEEKARAFILENSEQHTKKRIGRFGVFHKGQAVPIGICGLFEMSEEPFKGQLAIGYRFAGAHWGKGFARESATEILRYGLEELKFKEIMALIDPRNLRSVRVAEKLKLILTGDVTYKGKLCQRWITSSVI
jgi:RimJ/RimL family protein N-acetyltransferase